MSVPNIRGETKKIKERKRNMDSVVKEDVPDRADLTYVHCAIVLHTNIYRWKWNACSLAKYYINHLWEPTIDQNIKLLEQQNNWQYSRKNKMQTKILYIIVIEKMKSHIRNKSHSIKLLIVTILKTNLLKCYCLLFC